MNDDTEKDENEENIGENVEIEKVEKALPYKMSKKLLKEYLADLCKRLEDALADQDRPRDVSLSLRRHSGAMDKVMLYMLSVAVEEEHSLDSLPYFAVALKAQSQHRRILETINDVEYKEARASYLRSEADRLWRVLNDKQNRDERKMLDKRGY